MLSNKAARTRPRISKFEPLEPRQMLSVSPVWLTTIAPQSTVIFAYVAAQEGGGASVSGRFNGTVDFDPGLGKTELSNSGQDEIVVARYTDAGDLSWARRIGDGNPNTLAMDTGVATDRLGNTYVMGIFQG